MARYRKVSVQIWNDEWFSSLSDDGKLAFLFVLTHPNMTAVGAMRTTIEGLAAELGWTSRRLREAFAKPFESLRLVFDEGSKLLWARNFLRHNPPESPNVVKAWAAAIEALPEGATKLGVIASVEAFAEGLSEGFRKAWRSHGGRLSEALAKSMANQEQLAGTGTGGSSLRSDPGARERAGDVLAFPPELEAAIPEIRQLWTERLSTPRQKPTISAQNKQLQALAAWLPEYGQDGVRAAIAKATTSGHQGVFEPEAKFRRASPGRSPTGALAPVAITEPSIYDRDIYHHDNTVTTEPTQ